MSFDVKKFLPLSGVKIRKEANPKLESATGASPIWPATPIKIPDFQFGHFTPDQTGGNGKIKGRFFVPLGTSRGRNCQCLSLTLTLAFRVRPTCQIRKFIIYNNLDSFKSGGNSVKWLILSEVLSRKYHKYGAKGPPEELAQECGLSLQQSHSFQDDLYHVSLIGDLLYSNFYHELHHNLYYLR
jgi:hypothetical protein